VVFRIDSGGGDALASDTIGRMVERVNRKKPVVVSMVDVAASGGYHIAYPARTVVAGGSTITGSIGSITGKMNARGFYNKLGLTKDGLGTGPNGDFYSDYRGWTPEEAAKVGENHWASYDRWIRDIARVRGLAVADVDSVGRGRVWTGRQALERRLVDRLGGLDEAVRVAKEAAGIDSTAKVTLVHYPRPEGIWAALLGTNFGEIGGAALNRWVGERVEALRALERSPLEVLEIPVP
jgi:protease-4